MAEPKCSGCKKSDFELIKYPVLGAKKMGKLLMCSNCGFVYGNSDVLKIESLFNEQNKFLIELDKKITDFIKNSN